MRRWMIVAGCWGALPFVLSFVLNYLRPDLMAPFVDHLAGKLAMALVVLLDGLGTAVMMVGWWLLAQADGKRRAVRVLKVVVGVVPVLLCTVPAIFTVLFGPIVFAFMFGGASP